ncbi:disease resistance protein At4g27190-like [Rosa rugosa]|uniref:disease resistance protein At4g27190-like n=1 Tax=Rosa rugosa TaxID=74645 RepID=UPI002B40AB80|nr:disease resistance protein At4g27190-like [Rosa rugosa]XP_061992070.1 disease resistance protein At4g27190-like [Rosa rugosa]XP_061992072.1 disease resistance protein At4g27190-like [Rosa rugosa]XP_061992073.1 disease resistance protein At4g27190-like [Rosa rugosa]XP_061992074.1 disease resistance protein At4g27190-like [Rosa rugosa]
MAFLIEIGTTIVAKLAEYMVEPVIRQAGYIICYNKNLKKLQNQVGDLVRARISMQHAVETEERKGKKIENGVQNWLTEVDQLTKEADDFLKDEHHAETKCLQGFCPNLKLRHHLSRKSTKMAQEVAELYEKKKNFDNIAYAASQEEVCVAALQDYEAFDSRTSAAKDVIKELRNSNTYMIGVYGIGGVGKTTLVKEVYKQLATGGEKLFDEVVMVLDLKKNPSIDRIQKEIAEKLGLEILETETFAGRARRINNRIKDKKSLVILDDVWENIDLGDVGLPRMETLKILLTSRSKVVLSSDMGTQKEFPLEVLDKDEAWSLFQKTAGDIVRNPNIGTIATQVAEKCGGLPLLIVTVARSLRNSSLQAWKDTFRRLKRLDGKGLTEKTYSAIEWSYNHLGDEELKSLFLLCGLIMSCYSNNIHIGDLYTCSMGWGLLKNVDTLEEAWNALCSLLEKLKDSCLLLDGNDNTNYRMHDLVGDVANQIMVGDNHIISATRKNELKDWPNKDFLQKCTVISFPFTVIPSLPEVLECPELKMFFLWSRDITFEIPCNIFEKMEKLKVLSLDELSFLPSLPPSLKFLKSLQTLCLDHCKLGDLALVGQLGSLEFLSFIESDFKELPKEIGQLTRLRLLNLNGCSQLEIISPNVLSSLDRLEDLGMRNSFNRWEAEGVISTERRNANLEELKHLRQLTALQIHIPDDVTVPEDLFTAKLARFQICIGSVWKWAGVDETINALKLKFTTGRKFDQGLKMLLKRTEDLYLEGKEGVKNSILSELGKDSFPQLKHLHVQNNAEIAYTINGKVGFPNLTWLEVSGINDLRFLFSSSTARSLLQLKRLQISGCQIMEAIVSIEEFNEIAEKLFCQLQDLEVKDLPNLTKFCSRKYTEFSNPSSGILQLEDCIKRNTIGEEIEEINSTGNLDVVIQHFLFDNKVELPNLKKLSIHGLAKLTTIWNNQFSLESSKNLETIEIVSCDSLKSIFPASVARSLQQLRSLKVQNCGVEEIVSKENGAQTAPMFVFSKLTYVRFQDLPQLRNFYSGLHSSKCPSLVTLLVYDCTKVQIFGAGRRELNNFCTPNKQFLFLLEKDSFPNLETLGLDVMENWDSPPLHLFRKLKYLHSYTYTNSTLNSLEKLLGLEKVNVSSDGEIHAVGDGTLPHLRELYLYGMRKLMNLGEDSFGLACPYFPNLEILKLEDCDSLKNLRSSAISFKNLTTLQVTRCKGLKYLMSYSIAKSLMHLTKLEVQDCEEMIEIVGSNENDDLENEIEFMVLKHLELSALPSLRGFCSGTRIVKFPSLEKLSMSCTQLETFIFDSMGKSNTIGKDIKDTDSSKNHETEVVQPSLFDNKVDFPRLKSLSLKGLTKLTAIWHSQLSPNSFSRLSDLEVHGCGNLSSIFVPSTIGRLNALVTLLIKECKSVQVVFQLQGVDVKGIHDTSLATQLRSFDCEKLDSVEIDSCENLKNIFPVSVARNLQQLTSLVVRSCGVQEIVAKEESLQATPKFVFPKVTDVIFDDLSQLVNFYPDVHVSSWPLLNSLRVCGCGKVDIFVEEISSFQEKGDPKSSSTLIGRQSLFSIEKDSFPNLEWLTMEAMLFWNGPLTAVAQLFSKLKFLDVTCTESKSVVFLDKLLDPEGNSSTSSAVGIGTQQQQQVPHLKELRLVRMKKLMHLGQDDEEDNSQSAPRIPNFPNLQILLVNGCDSLRNLRSSAISFNNLTTLQVSVCDGLKYLITYSMAKSLMQLTTLEVEECPRLVEIVGSNEDDDSRNEITFKRLKHLKLSDLPRLQGFCSGNCIAKFPSLETSTMSNRLKLKIFPAHDQTLQLTNEEEDTDLDFLEEELTAEDEMNSASSD